MGQGDSSCVSVVKLHRDEIIVLVDIRTSVDDGAGVEAAVLLAPVGSDAGSLWEVAHRWRLHVDDGLLQQLLQAVDVRPVPSLPFHHHAVYVGGVDSVHVSSVQQLVVHRDQDSESVHQ